jgi:hypothetical protein
VAFKQGMGRALDNIGLASACIGIELAGGSDRVVKASIFLGGLGPQGHVVKVASAIAGSPFRRDCWPLKQSTLTSISVAAAAT